MLRIDEIIRILFNAYSTVFVAIGIVTKQPNRNAGVTSDGVTSKPEASRGIDISFWVLYNGLINTYSVQ